MQSLGWESEWQTRTFGDCAVLVRESVSLPEVEDVPYVGLEHIGKDTLTLLAHGEASSVTSTKTRFKHGDILFGKLRPYFRKVVRSPFDGICSTDIWVVRATEGVDQGFLYYCMASWPFVDFATAGAQGTRMPRAKWEHVSRYETYLPPLPEQRAIAHVLGTLDDRIELNRQMNETLEEMARALFKSWFVDFEPVRAKMEGRWRRGQSLPGMPADLYDLFPDRLADSELGEIPDGWEVVPLPEAMDFREGPGIRHWQYTNSLEGTRFINIRCIQNGDLHLDTANRIKTEEADGKYAHFHLKEWDIVVSTSGTLGRIAIVRKAHLPLVLNTSVIRFRPVNNRSSFSFLYGYLNSSLFLDEMRILASGSVQKNFGPTHLKQMRVLCPPLELIERHEETANPLYRQAISRRASNDNFSRLRDYLLPKLISGELRTNRWNVKKELTEL